MKIRTGAQYRFSVAGRALALCVALVGAQTGASALAQEERNVAGASEAFSKAQKAELRGDFVEAASNYALADEMAPAAEALRGAARSAQQAGLNATAATHAETLLAREHDAASKTLAEDILRSTAPSLAHLHVSCDAPCKVLIDGRMTASHRGQDHVLYARPGERGVSASFEGVNAPTQQVSLKAGANEEFSFGAPVASAPLVASTDSTPATHREERHGISPYYFYSAGALTLVAGGLTVWSGLKVNSKHDDYDRSAATAKSDYDDGRKWEKQTNALIGVTAALAASTVALAFFSDFKGKDSSAEKQTASRAPSMSMSATRQGAMLGLTGSF